MLYRIYLLVVDLSYDLVRNRVMVVIYIHYIIYYLYLYYNVFCTGNRRVLLYRNIIALG